MEYTGDTISIEEMPFGCVIVENRELARRAQNFIIVRTSKDAKAIIESLQRMVESFESTPENE